LVNVVIAGHDEQMSLFDAGGLKQGEPLAEIRVRLSTQPAIAF
jgi:hypothetical protein